MVTIWILMSLLATLCLVVAGVKLGVHNLLAHFTQTLHLKDGSHISPPSKPKQPLRATKPYELPPLRERTSCRMAMGLKRLDEDNWLTMDSNYLPEHQVRRGLLDNSLPRVVQCLPVSEVACYEVMDLVTSFLAERYPEHFTITLSPPRIHNHLTGESHCIGSQCINPMEIAARLAMEDFNVLMKDSTTGEYLLQASATLFPAGWELQERIGTSMENLHAPVPNWKERLGNHVSRYFDNLSLNTSMERYNLFIQTTTDLFQDNLAFQQTPTMSLESISVRRERQTFRRLPKSDAVLFTVRTYMQPLLELGIEEVKGLASQIRGWEGVMGAYKGVEIWGDLVLGWCDERMRECDAGKTEGDLV